MLSRILDVSIRQRWLVLLLVLLASGFGATALTRLPIDAVPDITNNQVQINTLAPSLSPVDIERQVTYPVETALAGIKGLDHTRSLSRNGFSQVTAIFDERLDIYFARQQVAERLAQVKGDLPPGAEPHMGPISTGLGEITMWSVRYAEPDERNVVPVGSPGWQPDGSFRTPEGQSLATELERNAYLRTVQDWIIRPQIRTVPGVAGVDGIGGYEKQYHVQPDPTKLTALDLSFGDVVRALQANNANQGARYLEDNGEGYVVRAAGRLESMEAIADVVVATRGGVPVRVRDVAALRFGRELRTGSGSADGREAVIGTALMRIGENSRTVAAAVDARMVQLRRTLPPGIVVQTVLDRTVLVEATIRTVGQNLAEGAALVIAVLVLLLGNVRAALVAALVIPVAMLMTVTGMVEARISANLMSLGALDFGLIVDGAVIITENALRHLAERQHAIGRRLDLAERLETVRASAEEMIRPSLYGQAIIILVYAPLLTFTGVEGKMFEPMALTVILALACAFLLSLTFVPALIAIVITGRVTEADNRLIRGLKAAYRPLLAGAVRAPAPVLGAALLLLAGAALLSTRLGTEFIPLLDEKSIALNASRIPSTALTQSQAMQLKVEQAVAAFPQVATVFSKTGTAEIASDPMPPSASDTFVILKPQAEWPDPAFTKAALQAQIEAAVGALAGNVYEFSQPIQLRFNELLAGTRGDLAVKVFGDAFEPMLKTANQIAAILRGIDGADDVKVEQIAGLPVFEIGIDRTEAARLGLSTGAIQEVIGAAIGGREAGFVFEGDRRFPIVVRLTDAVREDREALENLPVPLPPGANGKVASVLLRQVARFSVTEGPNQISRENGQRRVVVTANVRGRDIGSLVTEAQAKVAGQVALPAGSYVTWGGQFENLASARRRLTLVVPACFVLILLLLTSALGSVRDALLVFSAVPLALTGGIAALWLRGMPLSVPAAVGFIALSGVAVLNGLVMLSFIKQLVAEGRPLRAAILEGALTRLRPVAMTALVASLGFVPMALATGTGAEVQRPLATVVIGGLISATLLTLVVLPALYARFGKAGPAAAPAQDRPRRAA
ncbi:cobalt-zinc-cadmium resistance protein CzcA [Methylobacterium brachiatum]|uniref:Cobalt-zinc-cadmium resistance protein CzcA n=1 Tax=Methylobacterium brachiatum TaxID=269660 RepID=A0AAJ1TNK4_9HYPH|nr:CusA/CzcA family heavy metal efflux RND transporter [Methylobacterium brachiatum]MCB4801572.1 CusA/CzcA family heavy metal efflux RND transporter [Methylobacterium brachiatum]MDQ0544220.1 cobalt-zinc-cadmium resistance protein CzcA [Methylobacterium brachiatum]